MSTPTIQGSRSSQSTGIPAAPVARPAQPAAAPAAANKDTLKSAALAASNKHQFSILALPSFLFDRVVAGPLKALARLLTPPSKPAAPVPVRAAPAPAPQQPAAPAEAAVVVVAAKEADVSATSPGLSDAMIKSIDEFISLNIKHHFGVPRPVNGKISFIEEVLALFFRELVIEGVKIKGISSQDAVRGVFEEAVRNFKIATKTENRFTTPKCISDVVKEVREAVKGLKSDERNAKILELLNANPTCKEFAESCWVVSESSAAGSAGDSSVAV